MAADQFHTEIGLALRDLVPPAPEQVPRPGLAERVERNARARRRRRRATVSVALVAAAACAVGVLVAGALRSPDAGVAVARPIVDAGETRVVVQPDVIPATGARLVLTVANSGSESLIYGASGKLEKWDGAAWKPFRIFVASWGDQGSGTLFKPDDEYGVRDIGFMAGPGGSGSPLYVTTGQLTVGRYRFVVVARIGDERRLVHLTGQLEVRRTTP